eukprot:g34367.t1
MGEVFNQYFSSVFTVEKDMKTWELGEVSDDILGTVHIIVEEVFDILKCMKVDKSPGPDQIGLATGEVLKDWRVVNVLPLFKKGCKEKLGNYRPLNESSVV